MIALRWSLYLALAALAGSRFSANARIGRVAALAAILLSLGWLPLVAAQMTGGDDWPPDLPTIRLLLSGTALGRAWIVRIAALLVAAVALARRLPDRGRRDLATIGACIAAGTLAWTGHGAAGEGAPGWWHLLADIAHLVAGTLWTGALLALVAMVFGRDATTGRVAAAHAALRGFAGIGTVLVATLSITGLVSVYAIIGFAGVAAAAHTTYGRLLLAKLLLFALMLGLAALNRWRLTPALHVREPAAAIRALRISLVAEAGSAAAVLGLVARLGTLEPPG